MRGGDASPYSIQCSAVSLLSIMKPLVEAGFEKVFQVFSAAAYSSN
jgi:hypothetical protein